MVKITGMSSEHTEFLENCPNEEIEDAYEYRKNPNLKYCTYAWFTDIENAEYLKLAEHLTNPDRGIPIAVIDDTRRRKRLVQEAPIWNWIKAERTSEVQQWINENIDKLEEAFRRFLHS